MTARIANFLLKLFAVAVACLGLWHYLTFTTPRQIDYAEPVRDKSENRVVKKMTTQIGADFTTFDTDVGVSDFAPSWPCFRGTARDNLAECDGHLTKTWGDSGPSVLWRQPLGEGYSGAIVANGRVYVLDYVEEDSSDALRCFELFTGTELWRRGYRNPIRRNHGKSRTIPAYSDGVVVTLGPAAHVMAVDAISGDLLWTRDLVEAYGTEIPQWYAGQCPLIEDGKVILGVGGEKVLMTALDLRSGETVWETPNDHALKMSHASVLSTELLGVKQYVYAGIGGIAACDFQGNPLWTCTKWKPAVWAPTPLAISDHKLFLTAGYGAGSAILSVTKDGDAFTADIEREWKPTQGPASEQQTPILIGDTMFVIQPKDAGARRAEFIVADVSALPEVKSESGKDARFGLGPYIYADGAFWILDDEGVLSVYEYQEDRFERLATHKILPGADSWGPIAFAGGLMILRDSTSMVCLDLRNEVQQ